MVNFYNNTYNPKTCSLCLHSTTIRPGDQMAWVPGRTPYGLLCPFLLSLSPLLRTCWSPVSSTQADPSPPLHTPPTSPSGKASPHSAAPTWPQAPPIWCSWIPSCPQDGRWACTRITAAVNGSEVRSTV